MCIRTWRLISLSFKPDMIDGRIRSRWNFIFDDEDDFKTLQIKDPSTSESAQNWALGHPRGPSGVEIKQIKISKVSKWKFFSSRWIGEVECNFVLAGMFRWKMSSTLLFLPSESKNQKRQKPSISLISNFLSTNFPEPPELTLAFEGLCFTGLRGISSYWGSR